MRPETRVSTCSRRGKAEAAATWRSPSDGKPTVRGVESSTTARPRRSSHRAWRRVSLRRLSSGSAGWYPREVSVEGIPAPIRKSMQILATHRALFGTRGKARVTMSQVDISRVVAVFKAKRTKWALVGAHAVGLLTEPRATADFDFIVESNKLDAILRDLTRAFGDLETRDIGPAVQLAAIDIDLIRSTNHPLFEEALRKARTFGEWKVPRTEVLIALKFLASLSPRRDSEKRAQDILDLRRVYRAVGARKLDREEIIRLGGLAYPGAERERRALLDKIDRGEPLAI